MINKNLVFLLIGLFTLISCSKKTVEVIHENKKQSNSLLVSPVSSQEMFEGTRLKFYISAVSDQLDQIKYTLKSNDIPVKIKVKDYIATVTIDAPLGSAQDRNITIEISTPNNTQIRSIPIRIKKIKDKVFHCDPINGNENGDGSLDKPWKSLSSIVNSDFKFSSNDLILLYRGNHGNVIINTKNKNNVFVAPAIEQEPILETLVFEKASNWVFSSINIHSKQKNGDLLHRKEYIKIDKGSSNISILNNVVYSVKDSKNWLKKDWYDQCINGITIFGTNCIITNNYFFNTNFSIETSNDNNIINYNLIDRFEGDAIRNTGDNNIISYNRIQNAVVANYSDKNGNHDDAYQSWTFGKSIFNTIIKGNQVINCTDPKLPLPTKVLQGIVCFDGFVENWIVEDNIVIIDHPHGIALLGAKNCIIKKNIIIKNPYDFSEWESMPWIMIDKHKNGTESNGNLVVENQSAVIKMNDPTGTMKKNTIFKDANLFFNGYKQWDFSY